MTTGAHLHEAELAEELDAKQAVHVAACSHCQHRRAVQKSVQNAVRALSREAPPSPAMAQLLAQMATSGTARVRRWTLLAIAALALSAGVLFLAREWSRPPMPKALVDELALDHLHYQARADAAEVHGDPGTIAEWFRARLGFLPHYGALEATSFEGGKACRIAGKWTALVWLERAGHRLSLFTMPEAQASSRGCATAEGVRVCASRDPGGGARVLVGDLPADEMLRLVDESLR